MYGSGCKTLKVFTQIILMGFSFSWMFVFEGSVNLRDPKPLCVTTSHWSVLTKGDLEPLGAQVMGIATGGDMYHQVDNKVHQIIDSLRYLDKKAC